MKVTCGLKFQKIGVFLLSDNMMLFVRYMGATPNLNSKVFHLVTNVIWELPKTFHKKTSHTVLRVMPRVWNFFF